VFLAYLPRGNAYSVVGSGLSERDCYKRMVAEADTRFEFSARFV